MNSVPTPKSYDYTCADCGKTVERLVMYVDRKTPYPCECGGTQEYQYPLQAAFQPFEPFYAETLGHDIHGRRELAQLGLREAGDADGGARNVETSAYANKIVKEKPRGISHSDRMRQINTQQSQVVEPDIRTDL
jgi:hypothetical protein